ncbi:MAG: hypothetical protein LJE92_12885 [Gammaproteobacteria bacterium]|nr:hypothetical protein [Gammaproteobacteria bacterium]
MNFDGSRVRNGCSRRRRESQARDRLQLPLLQTTSHYPVIDNAIDEALYTQVNRA